MSGSAIWFAENPKITAASRNMHITGKEKTLAANPVREVLAAGGAVSEGEYDMIGKQASSPTSFRFNSPGLSTALLPQLLACVRTAPQPCRCKSDAMRESAPEDTSRVWLALTGHSRSYTCPEFQTVLGYATL